MKNKPFIIKDSSIDVTDRSGMPLKSDKDDTINHTKSIEMKSLLEENKHSKEKRLEINKKTDRDFLIESIKCAIPKDKRLNCKIIFFKELNSFLCLVEYQMETRTNIGIPRRFFDLLTISHDSKTKYIRLRKNLKLIDGLLSIMAIFTIILAAVDVILKFNKKLFQNRTRPQLTSTTS